MIRQPSTFKIQNPIGIITCQISPGSESDIIKNLAKPDLDENGEALQDSDGFCEAHLFCDAFSEIDLIGFVFDLDSQTTLDKINKFYSSSNKLRDIQLITCYPFAGSPSKGLYANNSENNAITLTLIRTNEETITGRNNPGLANSIEFAEKLRNCVKKLTKKENIDFGIYGTLGIPDIILIQRGNDLNKLLTNLIKINLDTISRDALFFHTIPCIRRRKEEKVWTISKVKGNAYWRIGISCYGDHPYKIIECLKNEETTNHLRNHFPPEMWIHPDTKQNITFNDFITVDYTFGKRDIVLRPKKFPLQEDAGGDCSALNINFMFKVLGLVSEAGQNGIETKTDLFIDYGDASISDYPKDATITNPLSPPEDKHEQEVKDELIKWFELARKLYDREKIYDHSQFNYGKRVIDIIERFQLSYYLPHMKELVKDIGHYLGEVVIDLVGDIIDEIPKSKEMDCTEKLLFWYKQLEEDLQIVDFALDRRFAGVDLGVGNKVVSNVSGLGNFKIIMAAKAVSQGLFKLASQYSGSKTKWKGFTVFGHSPQTSCLPNGIINMPDYSINNLDVWTRIGHETGHAYVMQLDFMETIPFLKELVERMVQSEIPEFGSKRSSIFFLEELLADVFDYLFCHNGDFDSYLCTTWKNLDNDLINGEKPDRVVQHVLRTICILFIHLENVGLLSKGQPLEKVLGIEKGVHFIYVYPDRQEGIARHVLGQINNFAELVTKNIIDPIMAMPNLVQIQFETVRINLEVFEKACKIIDPYRSQILTIFLRPKLQFDPSHLEERDAQRESYKKDLRKNMTCWIEKEYPGDVFLLLQAVNELENTSYSTNLAVILSLWDYYCRENPS